MQLNVYSVRYSGRETKRHEETGAELSSRIVGEPSNVLVAAESQEEATDYIRENLLDESLELEVGHIATVATSVEISANVVPWDEHMEAVRVGGAALAANRLLTTRVADLEAQLKQKPAEQPLDQQLAETVADNIVVPDSALNPTPQPPQS